MTVHSCWLAADEAEAKAILTAYKSGAWPLPGWTYLVLSAVDAMDVNKLERLVLPRQKGLRRPAPGGMLLASGKRTESPFVCVCRVEPTFLQGLTALADAERDGLAERWATGLTGVTVDGLRDLVRRMADFARQTEQAGKVVLQLDVL